MGQGLLDRRNKESKIQRPVRYGSSYSRDPKALVSTLMIVG
jgi:hypothetical protein